MSEQRDRWAALTGGRSGEEYARRFARLAAAGQDVHGEARFCDALLVPGSRLLDAGCGTGRVAVRLAELGHHCVGVDVDRSMLAVARRTAPDLPWLHRDLRELDAADPALQQGFDLVVAAGNVVPLLAPGTGPEVIRRLAALLLPGGLLVTGMGLDAAHLPLPEATVTLEELDGWCADAALVPHRRYATWDGEPYAAGGGYAVSVHRRAPTGRA
ncbi:methyltransferase domain-containing protein [Streptomyces sp. ACA25]|uniref:class I SAM-dependent methyltransferase n=1 Tax=Streptomyces sp. ACA25 TaxID=3022596 RepID=UPI002307697E|nr:class I SAM-dependent methyltransferase [Streptomyces sp. ACA25]MDB1088284.1 methyltransferase domain-containing protein [Streptomyces sp. ACA25]